MAAQRAIPAVFMRGGTSRAIFFHEHDLPAASSSDREAWNEIFLSALGSPDRYGRQLNGLGGGISSLSKIAVIKQSTHPDADVDYTFAQVSITDPVVGYKGNCGNISSAVGPFAVDEALVKAGKTRAEVRIHNTNTGKIIVANFAVVDGHASVDGDYELPGIPGTGAPIQLTFLQPGGATTGKLLPTGLPREMLDVPSAGTFEVSLVDAANPTVFVHAGTVGLVGSESPEEIASDALRMALLEEIRVAASVRMGLAVDATEARSRIKNLPLVAIISLPVSGGVAELKPNIRVRMISSGQPHRAVPLTGAMCLAVAAQIPDSVVQRVAPDRCANSDIRIAHPSGLLTVSARVSTASEGVFAQEVTVTRTARRLMEGKVFVQV